MHRVAWVSACFLAGILLFSGADKAFHYAGFVNALASYTLVVPAKVAPLLAPMVILLELVLGLGLLVPAWRGLAALGGAVTLTGFTVALAVQQTAAPGTLCGCWFTFTLAQSTGTHVAQNLLFVSLALTVWLQERLRLGQEPPAANGGFVSLERPTP